MEIFPLRTIFPTAKTIEGHGTWDGKEVFGPLAKQTGHEGITAVLTRATIRLNKLRNFWKNVDSVAVQMNAAEGFITSFGIGEMPWIKQATFSVWQSKSDMKDFAYKMQQHAEVIRKTRKEDWYSEDMFVRFIPLACKGSVNGTNPIKRNVAVLIVHAYLHNFQKQNFFF